MPNNRNFMASIMPTPYIKKLHKEGKGSIPKLEKEWSSAKRIAESEGHKNDWGYITEIFKRKVHAATIRDPQPVTYLYLCLDDAGYDFLKSPASDSDKVRDVSDSSHFDLVWSSCEYAIRDLMGQTVIDLQYIWGPYVFVAITLTCYDDMMGGDGEPSEFATTEEQIEFRTAQRNV